MRRTETAVTGVWHQVREILHGLDPAALQRKADRSLFLALVAEEQSQLQQMWKFFAPPYLRPQKAEEVHRRLFPLQAPLRPGEQELLPGFDLIICSPGSVQTLAALVPKWFVFDFQNPKAVVEKILRERPEMFLPLAKNFLPFRRTVHRRWIQAMALENALLAVAATVPSLSPAPFPLGSLLERAFSRPSPATGISGGKPSGAKSPLKGALALVLANQMRLAFLMAASSDSQVGFQEQRGQITAIATATLGWAALAGRVANRLSSGSGLLSQGLSAFVQTYVVGLGLEQFHALGRSLTREEKSAAYEQAYRVSRKVLDGVLDAMVSRSAA
ncbi:MAG: hypothetical protein HY647_04425 [Acidobacteria bacterium]|nr:hypothetical protein [Acidobacteriota bacterium]